MRGFILGFITAALLFTALHYQFILTKKDLIVTTKDKIGLMNTVVDTRDWHAGDYLKNPSITVALRKKGVGHALEQATDSVQKEVEKAVDQVDREVSQAVNKAEKEVKKKIPSGSSSSLKNPSSKSQKKGARKQTSPEPKLASSQE